MKATAFVDGSFDPAVGRYAYGCLITDESGKETELCGCGNDPEGVKQRNVTGEMIASMLAVKWALKNGFSEIEIHYDYTGIENWATARWKTNNDLTRSYKETMQAWSKRIGITFVKVEAHKGIEGNERADGLAKKGLSMEPGVLPV
ncbi:MAG: reverse transcriptase-like protein [Lachnospiraceae bacterium]|nr:reverse transcriptase-like protein [Lachnospiraceae bacterium]